MNVLLYLKIYQVISPFQEMPVCSEKASGRIGDIFPFSPVILISDFIQIRQETAPAAPRPFSYRTGKERFRQRLYSVKVRYKIFIDIVFYRMCAEKRQQVFPAYETETLFRHNIYFGLRLILRL